MIVQSEAARLKIVDSRAVHGLDQRREPSLGALESRLHALEARADVFGEMLRGARERCVKRAALLDHRLFDASAKILEARRELFGLLAHRAGDPGA